MLHTGKTLVVKLGTTTLTRGSSHLNRAHMLEIVRAVNTLRERGHKVILVSSGAMAAGREMLGDPALPPLMSLKQMLAAVGQGRLIEIYENLCSIYGIRIGQILLTRADVENRERFLNARDALQALLDYGILPIVNENDAVSTQEIRVGDNDNMAALVGILIKADLVILLTDQKGLYTADPRKDPDAALIREVTEITPEIERLAGGSGTRLGTGGMSTKVRAAKAATQAGIGLVIASGNDPSCLPALVAGEGEGTYFRPRPHAAWAKKTWLSVAARSQGEICVDEGAVKALTERGSSLLPSGILAVRGDFLRGAIVAIVTSSGQTIAQGLTRYSSEDLNLIRGHQSEEIESLLGLSHGPVAVHRDDLVLL